MKTTETTPAPAAHTPLPWAIEYGTIYSTATRSQVASGWAETAKAREADLALIVTACNAHDRLVAALELCREFIEFQPCAGALVGDDDAPTTLLTHIEHTLASVKEGGK